MEPGGSAGGATPGRGWREMSDPAPTQAWGVVWTALKGLAAGGPAGIAAGIAAGIPAAGGAA